MSLNNSGNPRYKKRYKKKMLERGDDYVCHYCKIPLKAGPSSKMAKIQAQGFGFATIDHRIPRARGGKTTLNNLVFCCFTCNNRKGDKTYTEFLNEIEKGFSK